jgi:hypothetical protein
MNKLFVTVSWIGAAFLVFFFGVLAGEYDLPVLHPMLRPVFAAADAVWDRPLDQRLLINSGIWNASKTKRTGVTANNPAKTCGDYTLVSSGHAQKASLLDMSGNVVHKWSLPFRSAWPEAVHVEVPADPALIYWRSMHLYPNGDLLTACETMGDVRGYGLVKMDSDSNVIWTFDGRTAGEFVVGEDGLIHVVDKIIRHDAIPELPQLVTPFIDDQLVTLSPDGEVLSRVSLLDLFVQQDGGHNLAFLHPSLSGVLRVECVDLVSAELAKKIEGADAGDFLVSVTQLSLLAVVGRLDNQLKWTTGGPWENQCCVRSAAGGTILVFDNRGLERRKMGSGIMRIDPGTANVVWLYAGSSYSPLYSQGWSSVQELPNGNVLITETQGGRLIEVTPDKQVVWEWSSPYRAGKDDTYVACVWGGRRYAAGDLDFKFNSGEKKWF